MTSKPKEGSREWIWNTKKRASIAQRKAWKKEKQILATTSLKDLIGKTIVMLALLSLATLAQAKDPKPPAKAKPCIYAAVAAFRDTNSGYYILGCVDKDGKYALVSISPYLIDQIRGSQATISEGIYELQGQR